MAQRKEVSSHCGVFADVIHLAALVMTRRQLAIYFGVKH